MEGVKCDEVGCGWSLEIPADQFHNWHNKPCPKCGKGVIINDEEMVVFRLAMDGNQIMKDLGLDDGTREHFDSAILRKKRTK